MNITIYPGFLQGKVTAIPSKSQAHRLLICAALADKDTDILCPRTNRDIQATAKCLNGFGADIVRTEQGYHVSPIRNAPHNAIVCCGESGSTLRFLLPVAGALGIDTTFLLEGRLGQRPLSPLWEEMERMGCLLSRPDGNSVRCRGKLQPGTFHIAGNISSQFITGLLFAAGILAGNTSIQITGALESAPYVELTLQAMQLFGVKAENFTIPSGAVFRSPGSLSVEGDWSNAAFFLAARALGSPIQVDGLSPNSYQGDRAISDFLENSNSFTEISCENIPDLVPIMAVVAAAKKGACFINIRRLRLKESDRVDTVIAMLKNLGIHAASTENTLTVQPGCLKSGTIDSVNDHRIAMAGAIAATVAQGPVTILGAQCVQKSYPDFWEVYRQLGGNYEQHLR